MNNDHGVMGGVFSNQRTEVEAEFDQWEEGVIRRLVDSVSRDMKTKFLFIPKGYNKAKILNEVRRRMIEKALPKSPE